MLLNELLTVALVPALINATWADEYKNGNEQSLSRRRENSRHLDQSSIFDNDYFQDDFFLQTRKATGNSELSSSPDQLQSRQEPVRDPILREIYEEERRLGLTGSDDEFDMRSEEARQLIATQRQRYQREKSRQELLKRIASSTTSTTERGLNTRQMGRSLPMIEETRTPNQYRNAQGNRENEPFSDPEPEPQFPILIPTQHAPENEFAFTTTPKTAKMGFGSRVFGKVKSVADNTFKKIFRGSSNTETTTTSTIAPSSFDPYPPTPSSNEIIFTPSDEDQENSYVQFPQPTPPPYHPGSLMVFEDDSTTTKSTLRTTTTIKPEPTAAELNCSQVQTVYDGQCHTVLQPLPCPSGQWLIEDEVTMKGKCVENKCAHNTHTAYFGGKCIEVMKEGDHCHKGMIPYIFKNGVVECDCKDLHLFNQRDGNCYPAYHRGPCNAGEIFIIRITERGALPPTCVKSKCSQDGSFCNAPSCPRDRNCVQFKTTCGTNGEWVIHPEKLTPACISRDLYKPQRIIGNVPTLACAPGSRRDILGTCRKPSES